MRFRWPKETVFEQRVLDVEEKSCVRCGGRLHVCSHRRHRFYTLRGPLELCCRLARCADATCPSRPATLSPAAELSLVLPGWLIGWDIFCFIGHRRFARHWSVAQIRDELAETYQVRLSDDALLVYIHRYQNMVAARQQDPDRLHLAYRNVPALWLSIDGLQPEKGHETLYAVREVNTGRIWFAQALLSSNQDEVRRLLVRARAIAERLGKPVRLWVSDKQDTFVSEIAAEFSGVPHRYCSNHFLRDLAKPTLAKDSAAKVQMRKKVRGLRDIERDVLRSVAQRVSPQVVEAATANPLAAAPTSPDRGPAEAVAVGRVAGGDPAVPDSGDSANQVVLDYCCAVRGILNDDQGGPLHPPGVRMAEALAEVRASLGRNLALNKPGRAHGQLVRLARCIDEGLASVRSEQEQVREEAQAVAAVAGTLARAAGTLRQRKGRYQRLLRQYQGQSGEFYDHLAKTLRSWGAGLFVAVKGKRGGQAPQDNQDLERWFRRPKGHERKIHGHRHAGVRIVQEGPTLLLVLNAHEAHPEPFTAPDLLPYRYAEAPPDQLQAIRRRKVMRKARSKKTDPISCRS